MKKFLLSLMSLLMFAIGSAWAVDVTFNASTDTSGNTTAGAQTVVKDGITLSVTEGILGSTDGQYRIYKNQTLTVSSSVGKITKIVFTCTAEGAAKYGPGSFAELDGYSYEGAVGTWAGESESIVFTASSNQVRATSIVVTVAEEDPVDPDAAYEAAVAAIGDGGTYFISTDVNGTKYYITADGKLTSTRANGCIFTLTKTDGGAFKTYGYYINGGQQFTNAPLSNSKAVLDVASYSTSTNNRKDWEAQVLFLNAGKYAIRATNAGYGESSWADAGRVFFTWKVDEVAIPQYTYDMAFQWELEAATSINVSYKLVEADGETQVGDPVVVKQEANSPISIPTSMTGISFNGGWTPNAYYTYEAIGTIGDTDCEVVVKRTPTVGVVHALTDLSNGKSYAIRCKRGAILTSGETIASTSHASLHDAAPANFAVLNYEDNYYLYSVADKKFVLNTGALAIMPTHGKYDAIQMTSQTDPYFLFTFKIDETTTYGLNTNGTGALKGCVINNWISPDDGDQYYMIEAADFDATEALQALENFFHPSYFVTYVVKDAAGNVLFTSEPAPAAPGQQITSLPDEFKKGFTTYSDVDVTISEAETTIEFTATPAFPFEIAESFADAKWYNMTIRGDYYVAMDETEPYYPKADKDLEANASKWAFQGDAYNGIVILNRAAGEGKSLTKDENNVVMRDGAFKWEVFSNSDGFVIRPFEGEGMENMWVNQSGGATGPLQFWNSASGKGDNGSTFRITPATPVYAITCSEAENGSVSASLTEAKAGVEIQLIVTPEEGYELDVLSVKAGEEDVVYDRALKFVMPASKVTVTATFKVADEESPKNITNQYLVNADLSTKDSGWTYYSDAYKYQGWETGSDNESAAVEFYAGWGSLEHTNFKFSQTITLPAGDYRFAVNAFYREGNSGDGTNADKAWIFAGTKKQNVVAMNAMSDLNQWSGSNDMHKAMAAFKSDAFSNAFDFTLPTDSTIEIGFEGLFDTMRSWCILGPVQLWKYSLKDYLVAFNEKAIEVDALIKSGKKMGATELADLQASLVDESGFTLGAEVVAAIEAMNAAIEAANTSIAGYAKLGAALAKGDDYEAHSVDDAAKLVYDGAVSDVKTAYEAATVADLAAALATVEAALPALAKTQTLAGSDLTVFITNPNIDGSANGWTSEKPNGGNGPMFGTTAFEYWNENASNGAFDYWQEIAGLPNGIYTVSADMYNSMNGVEGEFAASSGVYGKSGDSEAYKLVDVDGTELITYTTGNVIVLDGTLRIGVKNVETMAARWFVADNFKLTLVKPVDDNFDLAYEQALAAIGDGGDYYITTDVEETKYYITSAGKLTSNRADATVFALSKVEGNGYRQYGYYLDGGGTRFTNANLSNDKAVLDISNYITSTNNRNTWEAQVLFLQDGKYAIRATNAPYGESSWNDAGRVFFTCKVEDVAVPQYTYDQAYQWNLEAATSIVNVTYLLVESDGTTEVSSVVLKQESNSEVSVPASLTSNFLYNYAVEGTIGTEDCTITITRTKKTTVNALADLSNAKAYLIACDRGALLAQEDHMYSTGLTALADAQPTNFAVIYYDETDDEADNGSYYLYSASEKKFVLNDGSLAAMPTHGKFDALQMEAKDAPYFFCYFTVAEGTNYGLNTNGNAPYGYVINNWMTADPGNLYYMIEAADFDATEALAALYAYYNPSYYVTYVVKDAAGNKLFTSEPAPTMLGTKITTLPAEYQRAFTTYNEVDVTIAEENTTVEFTATSTFPFELSTDFASAKWYNMTIRGEWWVGTEGKEDGEGIPVAEPYYPVKQTEDDAALLVKPAYQWAFSGDAYNGIIVWNKGAGAGFTLTSADEMAVMREGEYLWTIGQNSDGFTLRETGTEFNCINQNGGAGGPLSFWKSSGSLGDNGSTFRIFEAPAADPVEFSIKENLNKTGIGSGTQTEFTKVKIDTPFKLQATAKNKAANNLKDEDLTIHFDMIMGAAFKSSAWDMTEMNRIVMQDVNIPYAQYFTVPIEFSEEYPFIQSINFVGAKLMKGDEVIAEFNPEQPFAVRFLEIVDKDGNPVGIKSIFDENVENVFDLSGRKVQKVQKGRAYIIDGKKAVIRKK